MVGIICDDSQADVWYNTDMKVSIIVPVYNAGSHLVRCLDSIWRQTYVDFEVIAVNDGSTDESGALLNEMSGQRRNLKVIHQSNGGQSVARNAALAAAQGEYVLMVDADDIIHPRLLELAVAAADRAGCDFVLFDHREILPADVGDRLAEWAADSCAADGSPIPGPAFEWFVESRRSPTPWQFLFRRSRLDGLTFIPGIIYEDVPFVLTFLSRHGRGVWLCKELYGYVQHGGSTTHSDDWKRRFDGYEAGMRSLRAVLDDRRYRLYVKFGCADWLRCLWRAVLRSPTAGPAAADGIRRSLVRCAEDGLICASDFKGFWKVRFLVAVLRERWRR